jgi:hypothetical protein
LRSDRVSLGSLIEQDYQRRRMPALFFSSMSPHLVLTLGLAPAVMACASQSSAPALVRADLAVAESLYADLRSIRDRIDVDLEAGRTGRADAVPAHNALRQTLAKSLAAVDSAALSGDDGRALGIMRRTLARDLGAVAAPSASSGPAPRRSLPAITTPAR